MLSSPPPGDTPNRRSKPLEPGLWQSRGKSGMIQDLDQIFFPSYHLFWPRKEFWPNTLLVLLWDGSEQDLEAAQQLHEKWDPLLRSKESSQWRTEPWLDFYEEKPSRLVVCDVKKAGGTDRPSNYGYIQQAHSYLEADLRIFQQRSVLQRALGVSSLEDLFILLVDADMTFLSPVHPLLLFDLREDGTFLPRLHGVWGRRAEGDISSEANFRAAPPVADFMDQPPWILRAADFPRLRERMTQAVFSNIHQFFFVAANDFKARAAVDKVPFLADDPPVAWLRWRFRNAQRHGLLRFHTRGPARPSAAFYEVERLQAQLPFADMEISWIEDNNTDAKVFESFTWPIAMGIVWRCAHPFQLLSSHDRSAAHVNLLFNNLFWLLTSESGVGTSSERRPMPYRFLFRRIAFLPDPPRFDLTRAEGHRLQDFLQHYVEKEEFYDGTRWLQSLPLSRFHLEVLREHDLSSSEGIVKALLEITGSDRQHSCMEHPHGFKVMKHWNALKSARQEASNSTDPEHMLPRASFGVANICLYLETMKRLRSGDVLGNISDVCSLQKGLKLCDTGPAELLQEARSKCVGGSIDPASRWECPTFQMLCEDSFWRLNLALNHHMDLNPYLGLPCRLPYQVSEEIKADREYLAFGVLNTPLEGSAYRHLYRSLGDASIMVRELLNEMDLGMQLNYFHVSLASCEIFDIAHVLQCHLEQLQMLENHSVAWSHWLT